MSMTEVRALSHQLAFNSAPLLELLALLSVHCKTSPSYCLCFVLKFHFISCVQCYFQKYFQKYFHSWYIEAVLMFVEVWKDEWLGFSLIGKFWFCLTGLDQFRLG